MTLVRTLAEADDELAEAAAYYEERKPGLGIELVMDGDHRRPAWSLSEVARRP